LSPVVIPNVADDFFTIDLTKEYCQYSIVSIIQNRYGIITDTGQPPGLP